MINLLKCELLFLDFNDNYYILLLLSSGSYVDKLDCHLEGALVWFMFRKIKIKFKAFWLTANMD